MVPWDSNEIINSIVSEMEIPENLHGKRIEDVVMDLRKMEGTTLLAIYRKKENIVNPPMDMIIEKRDKMVVLD